MKIATLPDMAKPSGTSEFEVVEENDTHYAIMVADYNRWDSKKKKVWFRKGAFSVVGTTVDSGADSSCRGQNSIV